MLRSYVNWIVVLLFISTKVQGQQVHFSDFRQIPNVINPSLTGFFDGDMRGGIAYRNQSPTISNSFNTLGFGLDFSLLKNKTNSGSIIGVGLHGFFDRAGAIRFTDNSVFLNFSYTQALDRKKKYYLSFGIQAGYAFRSIDISRAITEENFNGLDGFTTPSLMEENLLSKNKHLKLGTGFLAFLRPTDNFNFYLGFAAFDISQSNLSFYDNGSVKQKPRYTAHLGMEAKIKQFSILPYVLTQFKMPQTSYLMGAMVKYRSTEMMNDTKEKYSMGIGLGYRYKDAVIISSQLQYKQLTIGLAYDVTISKWLAANKSVGAVEVSLIYHASIFKERKRGKPIKCPTIFF